MPDIIQTDLAQTTPGDAPDPIRLAILFAALTPQERSQAWEAAATLRRNRSA